MMIFNCFQISNGLKSFSTEILLISLLISCALRTVSGEGRILFILSCNLSIRSFSVSLRLDIECHRSDLNRRFLIPDQEGFRATPRQQMYLCNNLSFGCLIKTIYHFWKDCRTSPYNGGWIRTSASLRTLAYGASENNRASLLRFYIPHKEDKIVGYRARCYKRLGTYPRVRRGYVQSYAQ